MGDQVLLQGLPAIPICCLRLGTELEQATAADRTLAGLDALADLDLDHLIAQRRWRQGLLLVILTVFPRVLSIPSA